MTGEHLPVQRRTGTEPFHLKGAPLGFDLLSFWQWAASDLVSNVLRGRLAEYIIAQDLGVANGTRTEWDAYDLQTDAGIKVEVKSAAYVQSWKQTRVSDIRFGVQPTLGWDASTNEYGLERRRQADVYVFCLLHHQEKSTLDPLDVTQWEFYVLPAAVLNERLPNQKGISLATLLRLEPVKAAYGEIRAVVNEMFCK